MKDQVDKALDILDEWGYIPFAVDSSSDLPGLDDTQAAWFSKLEQALYRLQRKVREAQESP